MATDHFRLTIEKDVYIYRINSVDPQTVDAVLAADRQQNAAVLQRGNHALKMWLLEKILIPTPYAIKRALEGVSDLPDDFHESLAIVISSYIMYEMSRLFVQETLEVRETTIVRIFDDKGKAMQWLDAQRAAFGAAAPPPTDTPQ